jgi:YD repeat-containing protein
LTSIDPLGSVTSYSYDNFSNQRSVIRDAGAGRLNQSISYGYNAQGDLISITDPKGNTTSNVYDAARRLTSTTVPNGLLTTYSYDLSGQIIQTRQSANGIDLRGRERRLYVVRQGSDCYRQQRKHHEFQL